MKIGHSTIPRMRVPALLKGELILLDLGNLQGQWGMVCSLPPLEFAEAVFLNQYHRTVQKEGAVILGMLHGNDPFHECHLPKTKILGIPLLADTLGRLRRVLGLSEKDSSNRCQSFIFDYNGVIRYHLVHRLNWRGMSFLVEILQHCKDLYPQPSKALASYPVTTNPYDSKSSQDSTTLLPLMPTRSFER